MIKSNFGTQRKSGVENETLKSGARLAKLAPRDEVRPIRITAETQVH